MEIQNPPANEPLLLPTIKKFKHESFKRIDAATLAKLISGDLDEVSNFTIIDCRYPYEYSGGHIIGSLNLHTREQITSFFIDNPKASDTAIIFHCEFSSERGPKLMKFLREKDRQNNNYPNISYPEIYLLDGGYKVFYERFKNLCVPQSYKPMKANKEELSKFKRLNKSRKRVRKENLVPEISFDGC